MILKLISSFFNSNSSVTNLSPNVPEPPISSSTSMVASQSFNTRQESGPASATKRARSQSMDELKETKELQETDKKRQKAEEKDIEDTKSTPSSTSVVASQSFNTRTESSQVSITNTAYFQSVNKLLETIKKREERQKELAIFKKDIEDEHVDISPSSETFKKIDAFLKNLSELLQNESLETFKGLVEVVSELSLLGFCDKKPLGQARKFFDGLKDTVNDDWMQKTVSAIDSLSVSRDFKKKLASSLHYIYNYVHCFHDGKLTTRETPFLNLKDRIDRE